MGFSEAVRTCIAKYADFTGRARRSEYWWFALAYVGAVVIASLPESLAGSDSSILGGLVMLAGLLPSLAVSVRRLHDTGRSGWFYLLNLIPCVGGLIIFIFAVQESQPHPNAWGASPKGTALPYGPSGFGGPGGYGVPPAYGGYGGTEAAPPSQPTFGPPAPAGQSDPASTYQEPTYGSPYGTPSYGNPTQGNPAYGTPAYGTPPQPERGNPPVYPPPPPAPGPSQGWPPHSGT